MNQKLYGDIVDSLVEKGFFIKEDVLDERLIHSLYKCSSEDLVFKKAGISASSALHFDNSKRSDTIAWIDEDNGVQSEYLAFMRGLQEYCNHSLYLGLTHYESHFSIYEEGAFYEKHQDAFKHGKNRIVTTVLYLNEEWAKNNGGELLLYDKSNNILKKIPPHAGTLVVFLSEKFPHEVLKSKKKRHSIAGWFRMDGMHK